MNSIIMRAVALAIVTTAAMPVHAAQWFMLSSSGNRCMDGAAVAKDLVRFGLPPMSSPYELTQELGREDLPFSTGVTRDPRGEVNAVQIVVSGSTSLFWFLSREGCEGFRSWALSRGALRAR